MGRTLHVLLFLFLVTNAFSVDYYWVGDSGDWTDINNWATTSGGSTNHLVAPGSSDNVIFDANSFSSPGQVVNLNISSISVKDFIIDQAHSMVFSGICVQAFIYGSFRLQKNMNWKADISLRFNALQPGNTIVTAGHFIEELRFQGVGGGWILEDSLRAEEIRLTQGTLNTNSQYVESELFTSISANNRSLVMGQSVIKTQDLEIEGNNISVDPGNSTVVLGDDQNALFRISNTPALTFYDVVFTEFNGQLRTNNMQLTLNDLEFQKDGFLNASTNLNNLIIYGNNTLNISPGKTQHLSGDIICNSTCVSYVQIICNSNQAVFTSNSGAITVEYAYLENIHATGGATFNAVHSHDLGNNPGWNFTMPPPRTLYWVNGGGHWNDTARWSLSSGGAAGECPPTFVDDVIFDQHSGNCDTLFLGADPVECNNFTWIKNDSCPNTLSGVNTMNVHGSFSLDQYVNFWHRGILQFRSNDMGETIQTGNSLLPCLVRFSGSGGWTLQDSLKLPEMDLKLNAGHLNTNDQYIACGAFISNTPTQKSLTLGSSTIKLAHPDSTYWFMKQDVVTLDAGTSQIIFADSLAKVYNVETPALDYHNMTFLYENGEASIVNHQTGFNKLSFFGNGKMYGNAVMDTLHFNEGRIYELEANSTQTVIHHLDASGGCLGWITLQSLSLSDTAMIFSPMGTIGVDQVSMRGIKGYGGATFLANQSEDLGDNAGWTFTSPGGTDLYWVGGPGHWSDTAHWANSSGGPGGACLPGPTDNVFFDQNSFNASGDSVVIDNINALCNSMDWTNVNVMPVLSGKENQRLRIFGSLWFPDTFLLQFNGYTYFPSSDTGNVIYSGEHWFRNHVLFDGTGEWTLLDTLKCDSSIYLNGGSLSLNQKGMYTHQFTSETVVPKAMDLSGAYIRVTADDLYDAFSMNCDSLVTFNSANSLVEFTGSKSGIYNMGACHIHYDRILFSDSGGGAHEVTASMLVNPLFNKVTFVDNGNIWGNNTFDTLVFSKSMTYELSHHDTQTIINHWHAAGDCNNYIHIRTESPGDEAFVQQVNGNAQLDYVRIKDIHGMGSAGYHAINSEDLGNTAGWTVTPPLPLDLYWVNGSGSWFNPDHWSYSSGGPGGACIPTKRDNVYFDHNSFPNDSSNEVTMVDFGECHTMDWTGAAYHPVYQGSQLSLYGSLTYIDSMSANVTLRLKSDTTGNTIESAGHVFPYVYFDQSGGEWSLLDGLEANQSIQLRHGTLNTNGHPMKCRTFESSFNNNRTLNLDTSNVFISRQWRMNGNNLTLDAGTSHIHLNDSGSAVPLNMEILNGSVQQYHNVSFTNVLPAVLQQGNTQGLFNRLSMKGDITVLGRSVSDSLLFFPGNTYFLEHGETQTVKRHMGIRGNNCYYITLGSTHEGSYAQVEMDTGMVSGDFINMRDIHTQGGATFYAGAYSVDISNNQGWIFDNGPQYVYGLPDTSYFYLGGDTVLSTVNFNGSPGTTYQWSTGSTADEIVVDSSGWYYVTVTYADNCVVMDSTYLDCLLDVDFQTLPTTCYDGDDGYAQILVPDTAVSYLFQWETGDTAQFIDNQHPGWYTVQVTADQLCVTYDSAFIDQPPPVEVPLSDTVFCEGDTMLLDAGSHFMEVVWLDGLHQHSRLVWEPDTFILAVRDMDGCWSEMDTIVAAMDSMPYLNLGQDRQLCLGESTTIDAPQGFDTYLWNTGETYSYITAYKTGNYWVRITQGACTTSDTLTLLPCQPEFNLPNVFTPNDDGYNDRFIPETTNITDFEMVIYSRWGNEVFRTRDMQNGWDGRASNGVECAEGTYFYVISFTEYVDENQQKKRSVNGTVTLLR